MERHDIRCQFCRKWFTPEPQIVKEGGKRRTNIVCPWCGNGITREFRRYDLKERKIG